MATNKSRKISVFLRPINFVSLPFQNGLQYHNSDFKRFNVMNCSALCTILVTFGPVTPEFTLLTITPSVAILQKSAYLAKYVRISGTSLDLLYRFGSRIDGDDYLPIFVWRSPKRRCYGNQLTLGDVCRRRVERPSLFALAFDN